MVVQFSPLVAVRSMKLNPSSILNAEKRNIPERTLEITLIDSGDAVSHIKKCSNEKVNSFPGSAGCGGYL
jgi:hypothetical protein